MSDKRASLEVIAPSIEEAVAKGLEDLGLSEEAVEVEVLDAGSRGLFGLGSRQARVRLTIRGDVSSSAETVTPTAAQPAVEVYQSTRASTQVEAAPAAPVVRQARQAETEEERTEVEGDATLRVASDTVRELLEKMKVRASVTARYVDVDDLHGKAPVLVDVRGNDLSILIGPKAETLNALQYIASLIVGKELGHSIPLVVDVEGFRARREQQIRQLARRMADQALKTGRRQVLEPMPASERRLIHIELRSNPDVTTESIGEEPRRKVTINPKK